MISDIKNLTVDAESANNRLEITDENQKLPGGEKLGILHRKLFWEVLNRTQWYRRLQSFCEIHRNGLAEVQIVKGYGNQKTVGIR